MTKIYIGVDISKNRIDVFHPESGYARHNMEEKSLKRFAKSLGKDVIVVLEATGGYEQPLLDVLCSASIAYHRANPRAF